MVQRHRERDDYGHVEGEAHEGQDERCPRGYLGLIVDEDEEAGADR